MAWRSVREQFFLKKHNIAPSTRQLLSTIYPTINWDRVDFVEGLPWFTPFIAPYVTAQALPSFYSFSRFRIYLRKFDETRAQCLADIVHEAFHVLQAMEFGKGYGIGACRGFTIFYTALFFKHGYRKNPFEEPAFEQEFLFLELCEKHGIHGIEPRTNAEALKQLSNEKRLLAPDFKFRYRENKWRLFFGFIFCLLLALLFPVIEAGAFLIFAVLPGRKKGHK
jgi:hypothetical protein